MSDLNAVDELAIKLAKAYNEWRNTLDPDDPVRYLKPSNDKIDYPDDLMRFFADMTGDERFREAINDFPDKENVTMMDIILALAKRPFRKPDRKKE